MSLSVLVVVVLVNPVFELSLCGHTWHNHIVPTRPAHRRQRDPNQLGKLMVNIASGEVKDTVSPAMRNPSPRRAGGIKGGQALAAKLTDKEREEIARRAASVRWKKDQKG